MQTVCTSRFVPFNLFFFEYTNVFRQQIDLGEETGPRTVVSGLVNYIPIEEMRDKYLVAIVSGPSLLKWLISYAQTSAT